MLLLLLLLANGFLLRCIHRCNRSAWKTKALLYCRIHFVLLIDVIIRICVCALLVLLFAIVVPTSTTTTNQTKPN